MSNVGFVIGVAFAVVACLVIVAGVLDMRDLRDAEKNCAAAGYDTFDRVHGRYVCHNYTVAERVAMGLGS